MTSKSKQRHKQHPAGSHRHLKIDHLVARRKLEQLRLLTSTKVSLLSSAEPYRISSFTLFKYNLLDPSLNVSVGLTCWLCSAVIKGYLSASFVLLFAMLFYIINKHIESYKTFTVVRKNIELMSEDDISRKRFLSTHLGYDRRLRILQPESSNDSSEDGLEDQAPTLEAARKRDSFKWINKLTSFFWPYLSQVIHVELDEFFRKEIQSGLMAASDKGSLRLLYSIIRQMTTNILVIERCQLGRQSPQIKDLRAFDVINEYRTAASSIPHRLERGFGYDIDFDYHGDMNMSVIYRHFGCLTSRIGLKDVFLHFKLRAIVEPVTKKAPFVHKLSLTLLELPDFGYRGIALVELAELQIARRLINRLIKRYLLSPRSVTLDLDEIIERAMELKKAAPKVVEEPSLPMITGGLVPMGSDEMSTTSSSSKRISCCTRCLAKTLLCSCLCSNFCLRMCSARSRTGENRSGQSASGSN